MPLRRGARCARRRTTPTMPHMTTQDRGRFPQPRPFLRCCYVAVSGGGRDELVESFGWSLPLEGHAGAAVEESGVVVEVVLGVD